MTSYQQTKLFLTAVEHESAQAALHRALRRRAFTPAQAREKEFKIGRVMMRLELCIEEIQALQGRGA